MCQRPHTYTHRSHPLTGRQHLSSSDRRQERVPQESHYFMRGACLCTAQHMLEKQTDTARATDPPHCPRPHPCQHPKMHPAWAQQPPTPRAPHPPRCCSSAAAWANARGATTAVLLVLLPRKLHHHAGSAPISRRRPPPHAVLTGRLTECVCWLRLLTPAWWSLSSSSEPPRSVCP